MRAPLSILFAAAVAGCATTTPPPTPDQLVTEAVMRCQQKHLPVPTLNSPMDGVNLHNQTLATDYDRLVNTLRTPEGWAMVEARARRAQEPISKFCTLEIAVRLDPAKARALYATLKDNDDLGLYIARDEYMKQALAPYRPAPGQVPPPPKPEPAKGSEGN